MSKLAFLFVTTICVVAMEHHLSAGAEVPAIPRSSYEIERVVSGRLESTSQKDAPKETRDMEMVLYFAKSWAALLDNKAASPQTKFALKLSMAQQAKIVLTELEKLSGSFEFELESGTSSTKVRTDSDVAGRILVTIKGPAEVSQDMDDERLRASITTALGKLSEQTSQTGFKTFDVSTKLIQGRSFQLKVDSPFHIDVTLKLDMQWDDKMADQSSQEYKDAVKAAENVLKSMMGDDGVDYSQIVWSFKKGSVIASARIPQFCAGAFSENKKKMQNFNILSTPNLSEYMFASSKNEARDFKMKVYFSKPWGPVLMNPRAPILTRLSLKNILGAEGKLVLNEILANTDSLVLYKDDKQIDAGKESREGKNGFEVAVTIEGQLVVDSEVTDEDLLSDVIKSMGSLNRDNFEITTSVLQADSKSEDSSKCSGKSVPSTARKTEEVPLRRTVSEEVPIRRTVSEEVPIRRGVAEVPSRRMVPEEPIRRGTPEEEMMSDLPDPVLEARHVRLVLFFKKPWAGLLTDQRVPEQSKDSFKNIVSTEAEQVVSEIMKNTDEIPFFEATSYHVHPDKEGIVSVTVMGRVDVDSKLTDADLLQDTLQAIDKLSQKALETKVQPELLLTTAKMF